VTPLRSPDPVLLDDRVAGQIGVQLDLIRPAASAALIAAGLLSVLLFPLTALSLLRGGQGASATAASGVTTRKLKLSLK
jgi:hypothetical protein